VKRDKKIERAAAKAAVAREWLEKEIRLGHHEGMSLRAIAKAAGVSHEQVRQIVAKD
jgi:AcrR family transcriptional regulator